VENIKEKILSSSSWFNSWKPYITHTDDMEWLERPSTNTNIHKTFWNDETLKFILLLMLFPIVHLAGE